MSKRQVIMLLGAIVMLAPHLGLPDVGDKIFLAVVGLLIIFVAYRVHPPASDNRREGDRPFVEHHMPEGDAAKTS